MFLLKKAKSRPVPHSSALAERRGMRLGMSGFILLRSANYEGQVETRHASANYAIPVQIQLNLTVICIKRCFPASSKIDYH